MPSNEWYYVQNRQKVGPVSKDEIRTLFEQGTIGGADLVWTQGMSEWKPASQVQARFAAHVAAPAAAAAPPQADEDAGMDPAIDMEAPMAVTFEPPKPKRDYDVGEGLGIDRTYAPTTEREFASFGARIGAFLIDGLIVFVLNMLVVALGVGAMIFIGSLFQGTDGMQAFLNLASVLLWGVMVAIPWLYYARQESSMRMATIGKRAVGIQVIDTDGYPLSFLRATGRHFAKSIISPLICGIGFFFPLFTEKKQALHDLVAATLVVKAQ